MPMAKSRFPMLPGSGSKSTKGRSRPMPSTWKSESPAKQYLVRRWYSRGAEIWERGSGGTGGIFHRAVHVGMRAQLREAFSLVKSPQCDCGRRAAAPSGCTYAIEISENEGA